MRLPNVVPVDIRVFRFSLFRHSGESRNPESSTAKILWVPAKAGTTGLGGYVGRRNRSFVLLYRNAPIRKYTVHRLHIDHETGEKTTEPHKHTWDEINQDRKIYLPNDIRIGNVNHELVDFLRECNIQLRGAYADEEFAELRQGGLL